MKNKEGEIIELLKSFLDWTKYKLFLHINSKKEIYFYEGQIWWAALGKNVGYEMDGKHKLFERPVLIIKKYSSGMCFVLPLTTKVKKRNVWYQVKVLINGKKNAINITQGKSISSKRLLRKKTNLAPEEYDRIFKKFIDHF